MNARDPHYKALIPFTPERASKGYTEHALGLIRIGWNLRDRMARAEPGELDAFVLEMQAAVDAVIKGHRP